MNTRHRPGQRTASHGDDWLITYTDTITLLLCLFVTLLSISVTRRHDADRSAVHVDPIARPAPLRPVLEPNAPNAVAAPSEDDGSAGQKPIARFVSAAPQATASPVPTLVAPRSAGVVRPERPSRNDEAATTLPSRAPDPGATAIARPPLPPAPPKGPRIYTAQISSAAFFDAGSATLSASGADLLRSVAATVSAPKFAGYEITVEGHTDDTPIRSSQFPSNWELSTARAAAVVRFLLDAGVPAARLRAAGYADTFPLVPNRDAAGTPIPANQARNRRVVIRLEKVE